MTYRIRGLSPEPFRHLYGLSEAELTDRGVVRMAVTSRPGFPCRITLQDVDVGSSVLLLNHVSQTAATPYRASHAIFVKEGASEGAEYVDRLPPVFDGRTLSLRGFDAEGMMADAVLAPPGEAEAGIQRLLADPQIAYIDAHNATRGCFAARVERL